MTSHHRVSDLGGISQAFLAEGFNCVNAGYRAGRGCLNSLHNSHVKEACFVSSAVFCDEPFLHL